MTLSKMEDYKVFLSPGLVDGVNQEAAIKKVVDAWSKQKWFENKNILQKFEKYFDEKIEDKSELVQLLMKNDNWFNQIFIKNIE